MTPAKRTAAFGRLIAEYGGRVEGAVGGRMKSESVNKMRFVVAGPPVPLERARVVWKPGQRARAFTPGRSMAYRSTVQLVARAAVSAHRWRPSKDDRYEVTMRVFWPDARRRDGTNIYKACEDSCNGIVWPDDSQIVAGHFFLAIDRKNPRLEVDVERLLS